ncbi:MAG: hypothetical protein U0694_21095 [Anaerolineae bacterium]
MSAARIAVAEPDTALTVIEAQLGTDNLTWYRVRLQTGSGAGFEGWVRSDAVRAVNNTHCLLP